MRFRELRLEKYGRFESCTLLFEPEPGLAVIYGPNEAGKSTLLSAFKDFLFGIPAQSSQGHRFGYPPMRLFATIEGADGSTVALQRRKGNQKTVLNAAGGPAEETLARFLGGVTRERFQSLFGLDHETLRSGGEALLAADGDIGRMIVEAGGGVRALVARVDALAAEADSLFGPRRAAGKPFYVALDRYMQAERVLKVTQVSEREFAAVRKQVADAKSRVSALRTAREETRRRLSQMERSVRIAPLLGRLQQIELGLSDVADLTDAPPGHADQIAAALDALRHLRDATVTSEALVRDLAQEIEALAPDARLLEAEADIRQLESVAGKVGAAADAPLKRQEELAQALEKIRPLMESLSIRDVEDLRSRRPSDLVMLRAQTLVNEEHNRRTEKKALQQRLARRAPRIVQLEEAVSELAGAGADAPLQLDIAFLHALESRAQVSASTLARLEEDAQRLERERVTLGLEPFEDERHVLWPDPAAFAAAAAQASSFRHREDQLRERRLQAEARLEEARAAMTRLAGAEGAPTPDVLRRARTDRAGVWACIRSDYTNASPQAWEESPLAVRLERVEALEHSVLAADQLADRARDAAGRAAELQQAQQAEQVSTRDLALQEDAARGLASDLQGWADAWRKAWPQAAARTDDLEFLRVLAQKRGVWLDAQLAQAQALQHARHDALAVRSDIEKLEAIEARLGLAASPTLAARVQTVNDAIKEREARYASWQSLRKELATLSAERHADIQEVAALDCAAAAWAGDWASLVSQLGLAPGVELEVAAAVIGQWRAADGYLSTIQLTQRRLEGMASDRAALVSGLAALGSGLGLVLPEDGLAAMDMLRQRFSAALSLREKRAALAPRLGQAKAELERLTARVRAEETRIASLCFETGCPASDAAEVLVRLRMRDDLQAQARAARAAILENGDGLSPEALLAEVAGLPIDALRAQTEDVRELLQQHEEDFEAAVQESERAEADFADKFGDAALGSDVAERESSASSLFQTMERFLDLKLAHVLLRHAIEQVRAGQQDPLLAAAGRLFATATQGAYSGIKTEVNERGAPSVMGVRANGDQVAIAGMSDGTRDQLFLSFRLASLGHYCAHAEPLPFVVDDILVHFDDARAAASMSLLAQFAKTTQVILLTHHQSVRAQAQALAASGSAQVITLEVA